MTSRNLSPPPNLDIAAVALFLDFDGTLVEFDKDPGAVHLPLPLCRVIESLSVAAGGALALVSGRPLAQLDGFFAPLVLPAAGLHGLEHRRADGRLIRTGLDPKILDESRVHLRAFADLTPGILLEDKGTTLVLHYRRAPEQAARAEEVATQTCRRAAGALEILRGKMVFELRPPGSDKGDAIAGFMDEPPFSGRRPVFAGDDITDEAGFIAVNDLGGISILVGDADRPTAARHALPDVGAVRGWLTSLVPFRAA